MHREVSRPPLQMWHASNVCSIWETPKKWIRIFLWWQRLSSAGPNCNISHPWTTLKLKKEDMEYSRMNFPRRICGRKNENWTRLRCCHQYCRQHPPSWDPTIRRATHTLPLVGSRKRQRPQEEIQHAEGTPPQSPPTIPPPIPDVQPNLASPPQQPEIVEILEIHETDAGVQVKPEMASQEIQVEAISTTVTATTQTKKPAKKSKSSETWDDPEVAMMFQEHPTNPACHWRTSSNNGGVTWSIPQYHRYLHLHLPDGTLYTKTTREKQSQSKPVISSNKKGKKQKTWKRTWLM